MRERICPECGGARLKKEALSITIDDLSIAEVTEFSIVKTIDWIESLNIRFRMPEKKKSVN